jgi:hypothetical protein
MSQEKGVSQLRWSFGATFFLQPLGERMADVLPILGVDTRLSHAQEGLAFILTTLI